MYLYLRDLFDRTKIMQHMNTAKDYSSSTRLRYQRLEQGNGFTFVLEETL